MASLKIKQDCKQEAQQHQIGNVFVWISISLSLTLSLFLSTCHHFTSSHLVSVFFLVSPTLPKQMPKTVRNRVTSRSDVNDGFV